jgi:MFS family permease
MIAAATRWFDNNRSLAVSLVSAGMGVAPMTISPMARWLISTYDWRTAMMTVGIIAWALLIPAALLVRRPPETASSGQPEADGEGLSGLGGRLLLGVLADRLGAKPVLIGGLLVQAFAIGAYLVVNRLGEFYALSIVFGTAYGGVMPLYAVLAREYFGPRIMGTVFGAATMVSSLGMAFGPWAGGIIFDSFNDYRWLYIGSLSVGLGAMAVALAFPPLPLRSRERLQAA